MPAMSARELGIVGVALTERLTAGIILDGVHVDPLLYEPPPQKIGATLLSVMRCPPLALSKNSSNSWVGRSSCGTGDRSPKTERSPVLVSTWHLLSKIQ
jgi:hypothetical protein